MTRPSMTDLRVKSALFHLSPQRQTAQTCAKEKDGCRFRHASNWWWKIDPFKCHKFVQFRIGILREE
jgi:hypothetical protein